MTKRAAEYVVVTLCIVVLAAIVFPLFVNAKTDGHRSCFYNMHLLSTGLMQYGADHEDRLPSRDAWMDSLSNRKMWKGAFHCPQAPEDALGYAFNGALSNVRQGSLKEPSRVPMVYDSVDPIRNASDLVTSLPRPGRHDGRNNVAYADGYVKGVKTP